MNLVEAFSVVVVCPAVLISSLYASFNASSLSWSRLVTTVLLPSLMVLRSVKSKRLSSSGAAAAFVVGAMFCLSSYCLTITMISVFIVCSKLTKYKGHMKHQDLDSEGERDWHQVLSNGGVPVFVCAYSLVAFGFGALDKGIDFERAWMQSGCMCAVAASLSCLAGDTFASEIGSVVGGSPILVTTLKSVPPGTNGGVTVVGLAASLLGGLFTGLVYSISLMSRSYMDNAPYLVIHHWHVPIFCALAGLFGSVVDSVLGATLQISVLDPEKKKILDESELTLHSGVFLEHNVICGRNILSNNSVNLVSISICAFLAPFLAFYIFPYKL